MAAERLSGSARRRLTNPIHLVASLSGIIKQADGIAGGFVQLGDVFLGEEVFVHPIQPGCVSVLPDEGVMRVRGADPQGEVGNLFGIQAVVAAGDAMLDDQPAGLQPAGAQGFGFNQGGLRNHEAASQTIS